MYTELPEKTIKKATFTVIHVLLKNTTQSGTMFHTATNMADTTKESAKLAKHTNDLIVSIAT